MIDFGLEDDRGIFALNSVRDGIEVVDLVGCTQFADRPLRIRDAAVQAATMGKLAQVCMANGDSILQDLADCLIELCNADSAGVSAKQTDADGFPFWSWVATAGENSALVGTRFSDPPCPSSVSYRLNRPLSFRFERFFFERIGLDSPAVTDGLVVPWRFGDVERSIWIRAHRGGERFDRVDLALIVNFGIIASQAFEHRKRVKDQHREWAATTAAALTDALAYRISEPLRSMDCLISEAARGDSRMNAKTLARELSDPLGDLHQLVAEAFSSKQMMRPN